jgi:hypothetical protein
MMKLLTVVVVCITSLVYCQPHDENDEFKLKDRSHYIDPTNMLEYDAVTQTMRNRLSDTKPSTLEKPVETGTTDKVETGNHQNCDANMLTATDRECQSNVTQLLSEVSALNETVVKLKQRLERCTSLSEQVFFAQYIRTILNQFKNLAKQVDDIDGHYEVDIRMSMTQFKYLEKYADKEQGSLPEVHSILSNMFGNVRWSTAVGVVDAGTSEIWHQFKDYLAVFVQATLLLAAMLWMCKNVPRSPRWIFSRLVFCLFIVSIPWNWWHLYKKEVAKRHAAMLKELPDSCKPNRQSLLHFLVHRLFVYSDECAKFFESEEIDPLWEVPPSKALAVTVTKFFLEPAGHIGEALNHLLVASFRDLPFYLFIPMFILIIVGGVIVMLIVSGYRIRTPFFSIEPHHRTGQLETENKYLIEQVRDLTLKLRGKEDELELMRSRNGEIQIGQGDDLLPIDNVHVAPTASHGEGDGPLPLDVDLASPIQVSEAVAAEATAAQAHRVNSELEHTAVTGNNTNSDGQDVVGEDFEMLNTLSPASH